MRFAGSIYKDGRFWLVEIPILDAMTQGWTRKEAFAMIADLLETLVDRPGFTVYGPSGGGNHFGGGASDMRPLVSLLLRRQRERSELSLADAAARLGVRSRNT